MALVLIGAVLGQGLPVSSVVQWAQHASTSPEVECNHQGVCPKNPDGPCPCEHDLSVDSPSPEEPTLTTCTESDPDGTVTATQPKWLPRLESNFEEDISARRTRSSRYIARTSQLLGDEIFHPPRRPSA